MNAKSGPHAGPGSGWSGKALALLLGLIGLLLAPGGAWLLWLGGSPYYLAAGVGCLVSAWSYWRGRVSRGALVYLAVFVVTVIWAVFEVGGDFWQLVPRVTGPTLAMALVGVHWLFTAGQRRPAGWALAVASVLGFAGFLYSVTQMPATPDTAGAPAIARAAADDWTAFGRTHLGERFSPAAQITRDNVGSLEVAWTLRTGDRPGSFPGSQGAHTFEATPLKVGDLVYACTPHSIVIAIDADSGAEKWRYNPAINPAGAKLLVCRGVSYFETAQKTGECARRIIFGTIDGRLIALDALSGKPCPGFGKDGTVDLREGLGPVPDGYHSVTSPPAIVRGIAVVNGWIFDGQETNEPSGVIKGYDATTGKLAWSFDAGAQDENWIPGPGEHYTRGSPNSWTVISADEELGMVYLPMGNATPDYVGMHRSKLDERYSSSVVALDATTGKRRWHFQTVHHDIWDYDIGSQPVLFDMPMPGGKLVPALAQPTKQGDIYILDRRTGTPLTAVEERPVPRGDVPEESYSPTQPVSIGFPTPLESEPFRESDMWGTTPFDQLWCRIRFRSASYTGRYTPPRVGLSLQYPGNFGLIDWGSVSIGDAGKTMFVNSAHILMTMELVPRKVVEEASAAGTLAHNSFSPQRGTPYAAKPYPMLSPLGIPCNRPPWGKLTAIDLASRSVKWQHPLGTSRDRAPLGIAVPGAPNIGGTLATAGGLLFVAATLDDYLRAFDAATGRELWRARLPAGGQAAPMTYVSERTGRQYVVIAAGGHQMLGSKMGDYLVAYALPQSGK